MNVRESAVDACGSGIRSIATCTSCVDVAYVYHPLMDQSEKRVHDAKMAAFDHLLEKVVNDPNYSAAAAAVAILIVLLTFGMWVSLIRVPS